MYVSDDSENKIQWSSDYNAAILGEYTSSSIGKKKVRNFRSISMYMYKCIVLKNTNEIAWNRKQICGYRAEPLSIKDFWNKDTWIETTKIFLWTT